MCITSNQPDTKQSNPNPCSNLTTKQHTLVSIQLNIATCPTYPEKFIRENVAAPSVLLSVVIAPQPRQTGSYNSACGEYRDLKCGGENKANYVSFKEARGHHYLGVQVICGGLCQAPAGLVDIMHYRLFWH